MTSYGVRVVSDMSAVEIANRNLKKVRMVGEVSILKIPAKCFRKIPTKCFDKKKTTKDLNSHLYKLVYFTTKSRNGRVSTTHFNILFLIVKTTLGF